MEMTLYDDALFRGPKNDGTRALKRPVTLDFESPDSMNSRKYKAILTSPDLNMLKLASPELERFIISNGNITTTPTPTQFLFSKTATEEQEQYARGFIDALNQLHQHQSHFEMSPGSLFTCISTGNTPVANPATSMQASLSAQKPYTQAPPSYSQSASTTSVIKSLGNAKSTPKSLLVVRPPSVDSNSNSTSSCSVAMPLEIAIKEELQTVPSDFSSPPLSPISKDPINLEKQEQMKLERKRFRNRLAASKCRKRKLEKISQLEEKVKELKNENSQLESVVDTLREQVCSLKQEVLNHVKKGCQIMIAST